MTRVCICTGVYFNPRETQINFHIQNLFGGNTCVLFGDRRDASPFDVAAHAWETANGEGSAVGSEVSKVYGKLRSLWAHRTARVPFGRRRKTIQAFLEREKVDAVLAEFGTTALRLAPVVEELNIPMFTYFRGADASRHLREPLRPAAYRLMMPHLSGVFAVSQFLLDVLNEHGIRHHNSHVVPSGVDTDLFVPKEKTTHSFIGVGRLIEKKRPDITVDAFCTAARAVQSATLDMVGDGPMLTQCKEIAAKHAMTDRVRFHGAQPHAVVRDKLGGSAVYLQHSVTGSDGDTEGLPTAIQEAMSCGAAVISTRHAGIPEAVNEAENGFLVDEHDKAGFTDRIAWALSNPDAIGEMGAHNRAKAQSNYNNRVLIKTVEAQISAAVARKSQTR